MNTIPDNDDDLLIRLSHPVGREVLRTEEVFDRLRMRIWAVFNLAARLDDPWVYRRMMEVKRLTNLLQDQLIPRQQDVPEIDHVLDQICTQIGLVKARAERKKQYYFKYKMMTMRKLIDLLRNHLNGIQAPRQQVRTPSPNPPAQAPQADEPVGDNEDEEVDVVGVDNAAEPQQVRNTPTPPSNPPVQVAVAPPQQQDDEPVEDQEDEGLPESQQALDLALVGTLRKELELESEKQLLLDAEIQFTSEKTKTELARVRIQKKELERMEELDAQNDRLHRIRVERMDKQIEEEKRMMAQIDHTLAPATIPAPARSQGRKRQHPISGDQPDHNGSSGVSGRLRPRTTT